jgi:cytochrome c
MKMWVKILFALLVASLSLSALADDNMGTTLLKQFNCFACHAVDKQVVGPSFMDISKRSTYSDLFKLAKAIRSGSQNVWGSLPMPPIQNIQEDQAANIAIWIVGLKSAQFSNELFAKEKESLLTKKQELLRKNSSRINVESSLLVKRLEALQPIGVAATANIIESFFDSGGYEEKGDTAQLGIDGGVIQIDGFAPDSKKIAEYISAIESDHIGKVELSLIKPATPNEKDAFRFGIRVIVGAISSETQTTAERFLPMTQEIFVLNPSQFHIYEGPDVSKKMSPRYDFPKGSSDIERRRIGSVQLTKSLNVFVDELKTPMGIEYELIDVSSGSLIKEIYSGGGGASALRFTGEGSVYVTDKNSCRRQATRKYVLQGGKLNETPQPLLYIGTDSRLTSDTKLFLDQDGNKLVATLQAGSVVTVIGRAFGLRNAEQILIRTPLGLTGWIVGGKSGGYPIMDSCD